MQEMGVQSLDWEDPQEEEMATGTTVLAWRVPWTEEPGGLQSMSLKELDMTEWVCMCACTHTHTHSYSPVPKQDLSEYSPDWIELGGFLVGLVWTATIHLALCECSVLFLLMLQWLVLSSTLSSFLPCMHWPALLNSQGGPFADLWDSLLFVYLPTLSCEFQPSCSPWTHSSFSSSQGICWTHLWFPFPFHHL